MRLYFLLLLLSMNFISIAQEKNYIESELNINIHIDGTLLVPKEVEKPNLAVIIAGSGPTNRDGNQNFLKNNSLKKLAEGLSAKGIATFRYDKRIVKQIREGNVDENILFDDFVTDAKSVIDYFKLKKEFNRIYVIGHSQGSLVGMLAAKDRANGFISLAGAGQTIDNVITEQITKTAPMFDADTERIFKRLKDGIVTTNYPPALASIFRIDLQPFIMNWMQYDPTQVIKDLDMPVLIINGSKDIQVSEAEANLLKNIKPEAELVIIDKMNHILVPIEGDNLENTKSYNEPQRKISPELINSIVAFIKKSN